MTFGLSAATIGLIGAGATLASGVMGADAAGDAANAQRESSREATQLQREIFNQQRADQAPFREAGLTAQNRLMHLLGLSPQRQATGGQPPANGRGSQPEGVFYAGGSRDFDETGGRMTASGPQPMLQAGGQDVNALRAQLLPQFTKGGARTTAGVTWTPGGSTTWDGTGTPPWDSSNAPRGYGGPESEMAPTIDEAGLQAAIAAQQGQGPMQGTQGPEPMGPAGTLPDGSPDPEYGSLMRDFSSADFLAGKDPGYDWRIQQGERGLARQQAARGNLDSGRAIKDAMRFNQGEASQEYTNAFNRFQVNRNAKLNPLQSLMGAGQSATNQVGQAASTYGTNAGNIIMGAGNARASGYMGSANAISGAIGQGYNNYQTNQLMNRIWGPTGGGSYGGDSWRTQGNGMPDSYYG